MLSKKKNIFLPHEGDNASIREPLSPPSRTTLVEETIEIPTKAG